MQIKSRQVLKLLDLTVLEMRALKNKLHVNSVGEFVSLVRDFNLREKDEELYDSFNECLLSKHKTAQLI